MIHEAPQGYVYSLIKHPEIHSHRLIINEDSLLSEWKLVSEQAPELKRTTKYVRKVYESKTQPKPTTKTMLRKSFTLLWLFIYIKLERLWKLIISPFRMLYFRLTLFIFNVLLYFKRFKK